MRWSATARHSRLRRNEKGMRKIHLTIGVFFAPFLAISAITGLLWAYAPYLYLKSDSGMKKSPASVIDEKRAYIPVADVIRTALLMAGEGRINSIVLRAESGRLVYAVNVVSKKGINEIWVDAEKGNAMLPVRDTAHQFHSWIMKIHRLSFFGTKKELVAIPGFGLLLMLFTGLFLFKRGLK